MTREVVLDSDPRPVDAPGVVALMQSQGSYQGLRRAGLSDDEVGLVDFDATVRSRVDGTGTMAFSWRVRLGVRPR